MTRALCQARRAAAKSPTFSSASPSSTYSCGSVSPRSAARCNSASPPRPSQEVLRLAPRVQWYRDCSGSTLTARSDRPCQFQISASTGMAPNQTADPASASATSDRAALRERIASETGIADDSVSAERTPDHAVPASNQNAPVAGAQSKLKSTQTV